MRPGSLVENNRQHIEAGLAISMGKAARRAVQGVRFCRAAPQHGRASHCCARRSIEICLACDGCRSARGILSAITASRICIRGRSSADRGRADDLAALYRRLHDRGAGARGGEKVLEIGAGSGYAAAVLSEIAADVYTVERIGPFAEKAAATLADLATTMSTFCTATGRAVGRSMRRMTRSLSPLAGRPFPNR